MATRSVPIRLRVGSRGDAVQDLQRELRRRGPADRRGRRVRPGHQARGEAHPEADAHEAHAASSAPKLLKRLGLPTRTAAAAPAPTPTAPSTTTYLKVFPVQGDYSYFDDYGAPRGSGIHQGNDIMADRGTPLVAVNDGVISKMSRTETGLGGIYVWLRRADGVQYYYAHMDSIAEGLENGSRITVGQVVGAVGNTGDARGGSAHLHFEIRNAWTPINPYPHLQAVDPTARTAARARA